MESAGASTFRRLFELVRSGNWAFAIGILLALFTAVSELGPRIWRSCDKKDSLFYMFLQQATFQRQ